MMTDEQFDNLIKSIEHMMKYHGKNAEQLFKQDRLDYNYEIGLHDAYMAVFLKLKEMK